MIRRLKSLAIAIFFVTVFAMNASALIDNNMEVTVIRNGEEMSYVTTERSLSIFFLQEQITIMPTEMLYKRTVNENYEEVLEEIRINAPITDQMVVVIQDANRVFFSIDGDNSIVRTSKNTVGEILESFPLLASENFELVDTDNTDEIYDGIKLEFQSIRYVDRVETSEIPFETTVTYTDTLTIGETQITQRGKNGILETTFQDKFVSHELTETVQVSTVVAEQPVNEIVLIGNKVPEPPKSTIKGYEYTDVYSMHATAYTAKPGAKTASGMLAGVGIVAVDPKVIPFGTKMYIEGYGHAIAGDTGGSIKGYDVDLFYETRNECIQFGVQTVTVYILAD